MITFTQRGGFYRIEKFFRKMKNRSYMDILNKYGKEGVAALSAATPVDSGKTAASWSYEIEFSGARSFCRGQIPTSTNVNIAVILQAGTEQVPADMFRPDYINRDAAGL
ncbi:MAG: hypothetical protein ACLVJ6_12130 [Merdibacter sp.]